MRRGGREGSGEEGKQVGERDERREDEKKKKKRGSRVGNEAVQEKDKGGKRRIE